MRVTSFTSATLTISNEVKTRINVCSRRNNGPSPSLSVVDLSNELGWDFSVSLQPIPNLVKSIVLKLTGMQVEFGILLSSSSGGCGKVDNFLILRKG